MTECTRCGQCCRNNGLIPPDLKEENSCLIDLAEALREELADRPDLVEKSPCLFMCHDQSKPQASGVASAFCAIYGWRPRACREFQCWGMGKSERQQLLSKPS